MSELIEAKLRRVGNSLGIIIPNDIILQHGLGDGDTIKIALSGCDMASRNARFAALIGSVRGGKRFGRDKGDRY